MERIEDLKRAHVGEWLAIDIGSQNGDTPLEGNLVYHSPSRDDVWQHIRRDQRRLYVTFAGPLLEEGYAAAFTA